MNKKNRTTLSNEPPPLSTGAALESYTRGKNPNSRRTKPKRKLVKITRNVYEDQSHISGSKLRELIDNSQPKTGVQSDPAEK